MFKTTQLICCLALFFLFSNPIIAQDSIPTNNKIPDQPEKSKPTLKIGGALRFNYNLSSWKKEQVKRGGDFGLDVFRINAKASFEKLDFQAEYRFYPKSSGGGFLKEGYVTYNFNDSTNLSVGLVQNPFGNTTYNSHNWFFNLPYYVGFEDKFSMGLNFHQRRNRWVYNVAFFKNAMELDFGDQTATDPSRYSYDVAGRNKEVNQGNLKTEYLLSQNKRIGISGMLGGVYNISTGRMGARWAAAVHTDLNYGKLNVKLQSMYYQYNLSDSAQHKDVIEMAAYGATYGVARKAYLHTASFAYTQPVKLGPVTSLTFYENYSYMDKTQARFDDTQMNVLGCMLSAGRLTTYVDLASGKNQPWLGPDWQNGLSSGEPDSQWHSRFNINFGYYF
ncbi:: hypothetical protein [Arcticibacter svalbardensis MN12-7]|uniref:Phosphate-selective porin O and P n=1 Tax=Arcticibacter svalbardensis MN12-7 TaxID=1150600 RepID=R9GRM9_9SPHI|nr:hypothetical protein [Arcticibacter svalbardensis]EOR94381.1 : hypothetical protein [Arcticibacter svalbardensis MN12-7]